MFPEVLVFWDFQKNELSPYELCPHSNKKVWWICENGHSYQKQVNAQIKTNSCPICKPRCRKVVCVETNTIYDSLISAAKACGYTKSNAIWIACNDSKKTAGGYHWKYV